MIRRDVVACSNCGWVPYPDTSILEMGAHWMGCSNGPAGIALILYREGYKQVSRRHQLIARVDLGWEDLRTYYIDRNFGNANSGIPSLSREQQEDHYRRGSARFKKVSEEVMVELRKLGAVA